MTLSQHLLLHCLFFVWQHVSFGTCSYPLEHEVNCYLFECLNFLFGAAAIPMIA